MLEVAELATAVAEHTAATDHIAIEGLALGLAVVVHVEALLAGDRVALFLEVAVGQVLELKVKAWVLYPIGLVRICFAVVAFVQVEVW